MASLPNPDGSPADILAAWLYWETIVVSPDQLSGKFRGADLEILKTNKQDLTGPFASCWGAQGPNPTFSMYQMRADVRRLLPLQYDVHNKPTGKRLVNDSDLAANIDPATGAPYTAGHTVTLPEMGTGNNAPVSAGATLAVVFKLDDPAEPLRKIVFYDGIAVLANSDGASLKQPLHGIYQSAPDPAAKLSVIGASGQPNGTDRLSLKSAAGTQTLDANPDPGTLEPFAGTSAASDRAWTNTPPINISSRMPGFFETPSDGYGETLTATIDAHVEDALRLRLIGRDYREYRDQGRRSGRRRRRSGRWGRDQGCGGRKRRRRPNTHTRGAPPESAGDEREFAPQGHLLPDGRACGRR